MDSTPAEARLDPAELLALDIDLRLGVAMVEALAEPADGDRLVWLLRFAYGTGYQDALTEPKRGQLCRDHGLQVPRRRRDNLRARPTGTS